MRQKLFFLLLSISFGFKANGQWSNPVHLDDLNNWSSQAGFIEWYNHGNNTPNGQTYGNGIQLLLGHDIRFGAQLVIPTFDQNIYFRRNLNGTWDSWAKVWASSNLNRNDVDFAAKNSNVFGTIQTINKDYSGATWDNLSLWSDGENSYIYANGDENGLHIKSNTGNKIILESKVGIGFANPSNALDVNGTIRAKEVKVETGWADFVFKPSYKLKPLCEIEQYINANGHLPEIPSETEVKQDGVNVGDMQSKLLQKVEELTLYSIEQGKQNFKLQQELAEQQTQYKALLQRVETLTKLVENK